MEAHIHDMVEHYGEHTAVRLMRKHLSWYSKGLPSSADFRAAVNTNQSFEGLKELIKKFYYPILESEATVCA